MNFLFASFYQFLPLNNLSNLQNQLQCWCEEGKIKGTILLAEEGINANIVGQKEEIDQIVTNIKQELNSHNLEIKYSEVENIPFGRMKVKIKPEIITFGVEEADPNEKVGAYIRPKEWNNLISQPDVQLIDTRNEYEVEIGTFKEAKNPHIDSFKELNDYICATYDYNSELIDIFLKLFNPNEVFPLYI